MKLKSILVLALVLLCAAVLTGCEGEKQGEASSAGSTVIEKISSLTGSSSSGTQATVSALDIKVYYPDENAMGLVAVEKTINVEEGEKYQAAVEALMAGTDTQGLIEVFPKTARVLGVTVSGNIATVNFGKSLQTDFTGGSTGEEMLIGSVVNTLTEFPEIKKVKILIDGKEVETLSGHLDLTQPLTRMDELITK